MTKCPGCGGELAGLATYCHTCNKYVADMAAEPESGWSPYAGPRASAPVIPDDRLEDEIQEAGRKALELLGFTVYSLSQDRATRQTPGIADTYVAGHGRCTWAEWKGPGKKQSDDQVCFEHTVTMHGAEYHVWRHEDEAIAWAKGVRAAA